MSDQRTPPIASLHTPQELLETAKELVSTDNPKVFRGAVLEALAALESFIERTVFPALRLRFSEEFAKWLEEKTKMDFDSRLSVLAPRATGVRVAKDSSLWATYKQTRALRKGVVHGSRKITREETEEVIANTAEWLAYLGSTIELETALLELKAWVESQPGLLIRSPSEAEQLVALYFMRSKAANASLNKVFVVDGKRHEVDAVLEFGTRRVLVETKFVRDRHSINSRLAEAVHQVNRLRLVSNIRQACVVVFAVSTKADVPPNVGKHEDGDIFSVVIRLTPVGA